MADAVHLPVPLSLANEAEVRPVWQVLLDNGLPLTILFIFLVAVIGLLLKARRKDKCLKLFNGDHATLLGRDGACTWGDARVYSQGLELAFDRPHVTRLGLTKASALVYPAVLEGSYALCRVEAGLSDRECARRRRQVRRSFRPGIIRRTLRTLRNLLNTLRDAFSQAMNAIIGALAKSRPGDSVLAKQQSGVTDIGQTILGAAGNAYEPMLEAHIGRPVVLEMLRDVEAVGVGGAGGAFELEGYLVDYTEKWVAVFNVEHKETETFTLEASEDIERGPAKLVFTETDVTVTCTGPKTLVVHGCTTKGERRDVRAVLLPGCSLSRRRAPGEGVTFELASTQRFDMVAPRALAKVYFGADRRDRPD
ncbi:MAG: hypothetical protein AAGI68_01055 [Planctomycetota bacterium]